MRPLPFLNVSNGELNFLLYFYCISFLIENYVAKRLPMDIQENMVFANAQLDLAKIEVYGFDYDYTLASYKTSVEQFIHDTAKQVLVEDLKVTN